MSEDIDKLLAEGKLVPISSHTFKDLEISRPDGPFIALEEMVTEYQGWIIEPGEFAVLWEDSVFLCREEVLEYLEWTKREQREGNLVQARLL